MRADAANSQAWLLVQRGAQALNQAERAIAAADSARIEASFAAADSLFIAASQADSRWAEPLVRRAGAAYRRSRIVGRDAARIRPWVDLSIEHATAAIALDPNNPDALEVRGSARYWGWLSNLDVDAAARDAALTASMEDLERATDLNRNQAGAYASLSHLYYQVPTKTVNDVYIAAQRALDADEFLSNANIVLYRLFLSAYDLGQFDKAGQFCTDFGRRFPADTRAMRCRLYLLTTPRTGPADVAAAWRLADSLVAVAAPHAQELERLTADMLVAAALARASKSDPALADSARRVATRSEGSAAIDATRDLAFSGAFVHTILGDTAAALRLLTAYLAANPQRVSSLRNDPGWWFRDISSTDGFRRLVGSGN
jgi:serine/threonine-protein kinase